MSENNTIHPQIGSIIRRRDTVFEMLYGSNFQPVLAVNMIQGLHDELEPQHQDKELGEELEREVKQLARLTTRPQQLNQRTTRKLGHYREYLKRYDALLWEHNYLKEERYGFHDLSGGKKSA